METDQKSIQMRSARMNEIKTTLMARVIDMNEIELKATLLMMIRLSFETQSIPIATDLLKECIDATRANFRRQIK